jgi:PAS domain S-box-containing protein
METLEKPARLCLLDPGADSSFSCSVIDSIINQSPNPTWISDSKGTLVKINRACAEMLKISEHEVIGKYNILNDNIVREQGFLPLVQAVYQQGKTARFEIRYDSSSLEPLQLANHAYVILDVTVFAIRDAQDNITNAVIQHIDITTRRQSEEALQRVNAELEARVLARTADLIKANEALRREIAERTLAEEELSAAREELLKTQKLESLGVLAGGIAHDFNNILTIILGYISLARAKAHDPEAVLRRLQDSEKGILRARDLTQQLLTFARGGDPIKKIVRLNELLKEAADFGSHGTNIRCELILSDDPLLVSADEGQLCQVVHNLVINATQAMPGGGSITIRSESGLSPAGEAVVRFSVSDEGTGISAQHRAKIFDPYFSTKQSSGLGLTSCYAIIKKHGGSITVDSVLGQGSTFTVSLPAHLQHAVPEPVPVPHVAENRGSGRVLVMDDDPLIREVVQAMLEQLGYSADCVADGGAALERYRIKHEEGDRYAAVIMDLTVRGGVGGKDAVASLLELDPEVRAVVSSGYSDDPVMANCGAYGFRSVLVKPYSKQELSRVLHELQGAPRP